MNTYKTGIMKWFRFDGTGYIVEKENSEESILFDSSGIKGKDKIFRKGEKVKFREKIILGRKVAFDVETNKKGA